MRYLVQDFGGGKCCSSHATQELKKLTLTQNTSQICLLPPTHITCRSFSTSLVTDLVQTCTKSTSNMGRSTKSVTSNMTRSEYHILFSLEMIKLFRVFLFHIKKHRRQAMQYWYASIAQSISILITWWDIFANSIKILLAFSQKNKLHCFFQK